jgi:hypothetical protein
MLIGAYGRFWDRDQVDFTAYAWRMLGRYGFNTGTIQVADFRYARGVYVLYNEVGVYYVGLASSQSGLGGRIKDHLEDEHGSRWTRFSWFSFDEPSGERYDDGVRKVKQYDSVELESKVLIRDLEALLQAATNPFANKSETKFAGAQEWIQVATRAPEVRTFDHFRDRLT